MSICRSFVSNERTDNEVELVSLCQLAFLPRSRPARAQAIGVFYEIGKGLIA